MLSRTLLLQASLMVSLAGPCSGCHRNAPPEAHGWHSGAAVTGTSATSTPTPASLAAVPPPKPGCEPGAGRTFDVGPGKKHETVTSVPWEAMLPGDTVRIHHRPEPYREKLLISAGGTATAPLKVCGVPGPKGELPVLEGRDAVSRKQHLYAYSKTQERGLVIIGPKQGYRWGDKPKHVVLEGLVLRGANKDNGFTNAEGQRVTYTENAAAVFVERGEHVTVRGCELTDSGNGFFVGSGDSEETMSRGVVLEGSHVHGNGAAGSERRHNVYVEAIGTLIQGNRFGPQRAGGKGNNIKDRSAGTVVRYNWIEGGAHLLDLVEPEDSVRITSKHPSYGATFVYGNVLVSLPSSGSSMIHYGGDNGDVPTYRKGTLWLVHNTFVVRATEKERWATSLVRPETDDETVELHGNVVVRVGTTHVALAKAHGKLKVGTNWVMDGVEPFAEASPSGTLTGAASLLRGGSPGLVDLDRGELRPAAAGPLVGKASALPPGYPSEHLPTLQYRPHQATEPRKLVGAGATLGALEP